MSTNLRTHRTLNGLTALLAICVLMGSASAARGAELDVIPDGNGTVSRDPVPAGEADCVGSTLLTLDCRYDYPLGQQVTLTATPNVPDVSFVGWSDARCPGTDACKLPVDTDSQSVTALFSPQPVLITIAGAGTVTTDAGTTCQPAPSPIAPLWFDCGDFPLFSRVALHATPDPPTGPPPRWDASLCEAPAPEPGKSLCVVSVYGVTWASVGFGEDPGGEFAPAIDVRFRVLKDGTGAGTVRGSALDCGSTCTTDEDFGQRVTLSADAASGSTFVGWRGACAKAPTCSLAVGPVTAVVGVFDAEAPSHPAAPPHTVPPRTSFVAHMRRMQVSGHGRHRRILMRVQVNAPATIRARLSRGRRRVASWRWRVHTGRPLLRAPVPSRVRAGVYKLRLSFRPRAGHVTHISRRVRLPR